MAILPLANWFVQKTKRGAFMIGGNAFIRKHVLDSMGGYPVNATSFFFEDLITVRAVAQYGWVASCYGLVLKTSARRHNQEGYTQVQREYNKGIKAVLLGKPFPTSIKKVVDYR